MLVTSILALVAGVLIWDLRPQLMRGNAKGLWLYLVFCAGALALMILYAFYPGLNISWIYFRS